MGRNFAPPLDSDAIRLARLRKFLTQDEVAEQVAGLVSADGIKFDRSSVSLIERGNVKRPHPKVAGALSQVLGIEPDDIFLTGDDGTADAKQAVA